MRDVRVHIFMVRMILDRVVVVCNDDPTRHESFDLAYLGTLPHSVILHPPTR